ncbi:MAG: SDR family oxidoreductase [Bacteroidota bacterium]
MNLNLTNQLFIVGGATSGFGNAIAKALVAEGAKVIAVARRAEKIADLESAHKGQVEGIVGDITTSETIVKIIAQIGDRKISGALINAGGPPAKSFIETTMEDWDASYQNVMRWKVELTKALLPKMMEQNYGRLLYIESVSVKQPIENLVLSNSFRLGVVGFVKTLSQEIASQGVTLNIMAPGYHDTPAIQRIFAKKSENEGISMEAAQQVFEKNIPVKRMGTAEDFASLAIWLLSPVSGYLTGQTISVDGGVVLGTMG